MYIVIDGAVGQYTVEDKDDSSEFQSYLQKLRLSLASGAVPDALRASAVALAAGKAAAGIPAPRDVKPCLAAVHAARAKAEPRSSRFGCCYTG